MAYDYQSMTPRNVGYNEYVMNVLKNEFGKTAMADIAIKSI